MCATTAKQTQKALVSHMAGVWIYSCFPLTSVQCVHSWLKRKYALHRSNTFSLTDMHEYNLMYRHEAGGEQPDQLPLKRTLGEPQLRRPSSSSAVPKPPPEC